MESPAKPEEMMMKGGDMALIRMTTKVVMGPHQRMDLKRKMSLRA